MSERTGRSDTYFCIMQLIFYGLIGNKAYASREVMKASVLDNLPNISTEIFRGLLT